MRRDVALTWHLLMIFWKHSGASKVVKLRHVVYKANLLQESENARVTRSITRSELWCTRLHRTPLKSGTLWRKTQEHLTNTGITCITSYTPLDFPQPWQWLTSSRRGRLYKFVANYGATWKEWPPPLMFPWSFMGRSSKSSTFTWSCVHQMLDKSALFNTLLMTRGQEGRQGHQGGDIWFTVAEQHVCL